MFNSKISPVSFIISIAAISMLLIIANVVVSLWLDPFMLNNKIETHREKMIDDNDRIAIPLLGFFHPQQELITGTSRIIFGFKSSFWKDPGSINNLAISGQSIQELGKWLPNLIENKNYKVVWIGISFGMFLNDTRGFIPDLSKNKKFIHDYYYFGPISWVESDRILLRMIGIRKLNPSRNDHGFYDFQHELNVSNAYQLNWYVDRLRSYNGKDLESNVNLFKFILDSAIKNGIKVKLFINPSDPLFYDALSISNKQKLYTDWRNKIIGLVNSYKKNTRLIMFRDFSNLYKNNSEYQLICGDRHSKKCPFFDTLHYRPFVGKIIYKSFESIK